jgi:PKD repeat protein
MKIKNLIKLLPILGIVVFTGCNKDKAVAKFTASSETVAIGATVTFTNTSENASHYQWDFGDGNYAITQNPTHSYDSSGTYTVTLTAIGDNSSSTSSISLVVTGEITIFAGTGIKEISLYDTWSAVKIAFPSADTSGYREYESDYADYRQEVNYYDSGVDFVFYTEDTVIADADIVYQIYVSDPYAGYTAKGITIGSTVTQLETAYGTPGVYDGSTYYCYYYDDLGIEFFTSSSKEVITDISVYGASTSKSGKLKSASVQKHLHQRLLRKK